MNFFAIAFAVMLALVVAEMLALKYIHGKAIPWKEVVSNLNSGHVLMWVFRGVEVGLFGFLLTHANLHLVDSWPLAAQWAFAFIAWDLSFYWMHRLHHKIPFFWAVHVVHHQAEHFNLSLGIRNSWYSSLTSLLFVAVLAVFGVSLEMFIVVSTIHYAVQFYNHNGIVRKSGFLDRILVTPSNHRVHHGMDARYINKNFGGTLLLWDKVFGTYQKELDDVPMQYGLHKWQKTDNPVWMNHAGLLLSLSKRAPALLDTVRLKVPELVIGLGGIILFCMVIHFVDMEDRLPAMQLLALFAIVFLGTIALGGMSDERRWGAVLWVGLALVAPVAYCAEYGFPDVWGQGMLALFVAHGLTVLWHLLRGGSATPRPATTLAQ